MKQVKLFTVLLTSSLLCTVIPVTSVWGQDETLVLIESGTLEEDDGTYEDNPGYHTLDYELESASQIQLYSEAPLPAGLPTSYDSRNFGTITGVKDQGSYGTCWAFAAINSAETDAIRDGRMTIDTADLSEAQMTYFFYHRAEDPLGGTAGDKNTANGNYLNIGGNNQLNTFSLASWISPAAEEVMPYKNMAGYSTANVTDAMAYDSSVAHLQNAYWISMSDTEIIKQMIMQYKAVATSYCSSSSYYHRVNGSYYYYYPFDSTQNHAVSIVGWDDSIPASYFTYTDSSGSSYTPTTDGGWLIKNSYGSSWGMNGYFWISYEDGSLLNSQNMGVIFDYEGSDNYDHNYQYDGTVALTRLSYSQYNSCYTANVFTTNSTEELKAVGFYTTQPGMSYSIQVYRNLLDSSSPLGTAVFSTPVSGTELYAGYHTVKLDTSVPLNAGETYSIVVQYTSVEPGVSFFIDRTVSYDWLSCISSNSAGEGYYSLNGSSWTDCSKNYNANLRIKAFTDDRIVPTTGVQLNYSIVSLVKNGQLSLTSTVLPADASNKNVTWSSSNPSVATVNSNGVVTAKKAGTTTITVKTVSGGYTAACRVTVTDYTNTQAFVARLYSMCLGRQPDSAGLNYWNQTLVSKEKSGAAVGYGFVFSEEYKNRNTSNEDYVEMLYQVFMNRGADAAGKAYWVDYLNQGLSREYVFRGFAQSQEYTDICNSYGIERGTVTLNQPRDLNPNLTKFINRIYEKAMGRNGEGNGLNYWCEAVQSGARTPINVAEYFITSEEFQNKNLSNEAYIKVLYRTFMGREYDQSGLNYWLGELNRGYSREDILHRFANCQEFKDIMASFGL